MHMQIEAAANRFTLINTFVVQPHRHADIVASLRAFTDQFTCSLPGFIGAAVHVSLDGSRVLNYVQWASAEDLKRMLATPEAKAHMAEVSSLAETIQPVWYRVEFVRT